MIAARRIRKELPGPATVLTICCDEGEKYLSEYFAAQVQVDTAAPFANL
jgi:cysteine synthase A